MLVYALSRDVLRAIFTPRSLHLWWPVEIAAVMVIGVIVLGVLYVALIATAARLVYRAARRVV
jgi:hypothetical protein